MRLIPLVLATFIAIANAGTVVLSEKHQVLVY